jgi:hypothetical protein
MTAGEFDEQVKDERAAVKARNQPPAKLEEMVLARLRAEHWTYDATILEPVYTWRGFEAAPPYQQTQRLIDTLFQFTENRQMLRATLSSIKGEILRECSDTEGAAQAFLDAVDDLHGLHLDVDAKRMYSMMTLGHLLLAQGNRKDAETVFLDVLSYPFYLVMEEDLRSLLAEYYIKAGIGLIDCRRGDLAALKEIYFVPATHDTLMPRLQRAIAEAQQGAV